MYYKQRAYFYTQNNTLMNLFNTLHSFTQIYVLGHFKNIPKNSNFYFLIFMNTAVYA